MELRIFLSSTLEDLRDARKKILKLLSVIPADLVSMETFGSDESHPVSYCMERVRKCNVFIGVYAERYGTADPGLGKSITEAEYEEAFRGLEKGELLALLVYVLDPKTAWPIDKIDRDSVQVAA